MNEKQQTVKPIEDAIGQWINVGDVITHANRSGSYCWIDVGVVTGVNREEGWIKWRRVEGLSWRWRDDPCTWATKETKLYRTDLCTKINITKERLAAKFGLVDDDVQVTEDIANQPSQVFHRPLAEEEFDF